MALGASIRRLFGPWEAGVTDAYRAFFVDLGRQVGQVHRWMPTAERILEIGCGEGAICQRLAEVYPQAWVTGIDITPRAGRLFRGDCSRVRFECVTAADL